ncbi:hypothetical protein D3C86_1656890 [compost metagenome]
MTVRLPWAGPLAMTMLAGSMPSSASLSLPARSMLTEPPSATVAASARATGASLTGVTVRLTVTGAEGAPLASLMV